MDFVSIVFALLFSFTLFKTILAISGVGKSKNLPPGPTPLPIIGNLHLLGDQPQQSLAKLAGIHGPIMFLKFGRIPTLVISSAAAAREVLQKQDLTFSTRHVPNVFHAHDYYQNSVVWLPVGTLWRSLRKILNSRIFSATRLDASEHLRTQKVKELVARCRSASEGCVPVDMGRAAFQTSLNLLSNTIFSKDLTDPYQDSAKEFRELVGRLTDNSSRPNLVDFFPVFTKFDPQGIRKTMKRNLDKAIEIIQGLMEERLEMRKSKQEGINDDLLNACLNIVQENPEEEIKLTHIVVMFLDLFGAGTDTTSSTLEWAMTELLRNPHVMIKAKEELDQVIGKGIILEEVDVARLPYLHCVIKETLRIHPPVPFLIPRKVHTSVDIGTYTVPRGTQVLVNAWALGRDPTLWDNPLEFTPERFLTSKLDVRGQDFELIPFGGGRRICPGMTLALRTLPMMLGSLLNNFDWKFVGELDMTEKFGITLQKAKSLYAVPMPLS